MATTSSPTRTSEEFGGREVARTLHAHQRDVGVGEAADDIGGVLGAVVERDPHGLRPRDHMGIGEDVAVRAHDHTGSGAAVLAARGTALVGVDRDHRRLRLGQQGLDVEAG
jgi:hypothetical protein